MKLREQLSEAEKEIQQQRQLEAVPSNSSSSSQSVEAMDPPFLGEFVVDGYDDDVFYVPETHYLNNMEWINLYM